MKRLRDDTVFTKCRILNFCFVLFVQRLAEISERLVHSRRRRDAYFNRQTNRQPTRIVGGLVDEVTLGVSRED